MPVNGSLLLSCAAAAVVPAVLPSLCWVAPFDPEVGSFWPSYCCTLPAGKL